ncbi:unnamed protein product, partial [Clonostachys byssicola]
DIDTITPVEQQRASEDSEAHRESVPTWQPFWLRKCVLVGFFCWFLCCTVVLLILLLLSKRDGGIGRANQELGYLYRFAPTAIFTLVTVLLSRVELQVLRYYPWALIQHSDSCNPEAYHLNYSSMIMPMVLFRSVQRKHVLVALITSSLIILRIQTILSPALFIWGLQQQLQPASVEILDTFDTSAAPAKEPGSEFFYNQHAVEQFDMEFPFGIAKNGVYQTFEIRNQGNTTCGTSEKPLKVDVNGLFMDIQCSPMIDYNTTAVYVPDYHDATTFNITIDFEFESCGPPVRDYVNYLWMKYEDPIPIWWAKTFEQPPCRLLPQQNKQFAYFGCFFEPGPIQTNEIRLPPADLCTAMICSSAAGLSKVEIVDDGFIKKLTVPPNQTVIPVKSDLWHIMGNSLSVTVEDQTPVYETKDGLQYVKFVKKLWERYHPNENKWLFQNAVLEEALMNATKMLGPWAAHYNLRRANKAETVGFLTTETEILQVNQGICLAIIVLSTVSLLAISSMIFQLAEISNVWYRNPSTILGFMTVMNSDKHALEENYSENPDDLFKWGRSNSSPFILRPHLRVIFILYVIGLIVGLLVALRVSQQSDGLATVNSNQYLSFLWRVVPALAMFVVASYASTVDSEIRDIAILSKLSMKNCSAVQLDMSLHDMLGFRALYHSVLMRDYAVTISQILAAVCALLITISSLLFNIQKGSESISTEVQSESWFGIPAANTTDRNVSLDAVASLVLSHNLSHFTYPKSTYADLLFPTIQEAGFNKTLDHVNSAMFEVPAAKLLPVCNPIPLQDLNISIYEIPTSNYPEPEAESLSFSFLIEREYECPWRTSPISYDENGIPKYRKLEDFFYVGPEAKTDGFSYFGMVINTLENANAELCGPKLGPNWSLRSYLWGNFSTKSTSFEHLSIWTCNYTWFEVPTNINMVEVDGKLQIDQNNPPVQDMANARPWSPPFPVPAVGRVSLVRTQDTAFPAFKTDETFTSIEFSPHFNIILEPFGPIKQEDLGNENQVSHVLDALHYTLGLASVQIAGKQNRLALHERSKGEPAQSPKQRPIKAKLINTNRRRLVQDPIVTYVLIAILGLAAIVNIYALISSILIRQYGREHRWLLDMELRGLAPNGFGSIALIHTLLCSTNAIHHLPDGAHLMPPSLLYRHLADTRFRMGWFFHTVGRQENYTIGVSNDTNFQFSTTKKYN